MTSLLSPRVGWKISAYPRVYENRFGNIQFIHHCFISRRFVEFQLTSNNSDLKAHLKTSGMHKCLVILTDFSLSNFCRITDYKFWTTIWFFFLLLFRSLLNLPKTIMLSYMISFDFKNVAFFVSRFFRNLTKRNLDLKHFLSIRYNL